jgi:Zn ribbon nucleic-acid-binding protein
MAKKKTHEQYVKEVYDIVGDEYEVVGEYNSYHKKIELKHNQCKHTFSMTPANFLSGQRCPKCSKIAGNNKQTKTHEIFLKEVYELVGNDYLLLEPYETAKTKIRVLHNKCGNTWLIAPDKFLRGRRCPVCATEHAHTIQRRTQQEFEELVFQIGNNEYIVLNNYINANESIRLKHKICGHSFNVRANHFINGSRCPRCRESKGEKQIGKYLNSNDIPHEPQYSFVGCINKRLLRFDFAIFNKENKLIYLIEYDGELHFESVEYFGGDEKLQQQIENDKIKNTYCKNNNIKLYRIPYWMLDNIEKILSKIIHNEVFETDENYYVI